MWVEQGGGAQEVGKNVTVLPCRDTSLKVVAGTERMKEVSQKETLQSKGRRLGNRP